jgi:anaerobic magnesium-protoporphyrin IX monomethyl ester cyclase
MSSKDLVLATPEQDCRVQNENQEARLHMARPSEDTNFDFLAVNVPSTYQQGLIPDGDEPPWGLLRVVVSARERFGFKAGILDAHRLKLQPDDIAAQIRSTGAKIVGMNPTSMNVSQATVIAEICDRIGVPYIVGGVHATLDPVKAASDFPNVMAIIRGNGELAIGEVLSSVLKSGPKDLPGIWYNGNAPLTNLEYAPKINLEEIPLVRQDIYVQDPVYSYTAYDGAAYRRFKEATLFVTYGCPFECTFCSSPIMVNRGKDVPYLRPGISRIVDEIECAISRLGADAIHFLDDMVFVCGRHIRDFHEELKERNLLGRFVWRGLTRASILLKPNFNGEVMNLMKESGAWKIAIGVESGNDEVLKRIRKHVTTAQVVEAVRKLVQYGIRAKGFFVLGFPDETKQQIEDTVRFIMELKDVGMTEISIFQFKPYPGTREYEFLLRERPDVINRLSYLKRTYGDLQGRAKERAESHVWLPDDLRIAEIPSGEVRRYIVKALEAFYCPAVG